MKSGFLPALALALVAAGFTCSPASAQHPGANAFAGGGFPWMPFGFYQPYGAHYGTSLRTPPYFALNPPVYYGTRYSRPYGLSPFAAPPVVNAPASYEGRVAQRFVSPPVTNPYVEGACEQCSHSGSTSGEWEARKTDVPQATVVKAAKVIGAVRTNPFVEQASRVASR